MRTATVSGAVSGITGDTMDFRDVRSGIKLIYSRLSGRRIPLVVSIQLTEDCNLNCDYCSFGEKGEQLKTSEVKNLLDQLDGQGTEKIVFTGGEPLLREDIDELVDYAQEKGFEINLNSNGLLVPAKIETVRKVDLLVLSLDGPEKIHEKNRGRGSFKGVMKAARAARDNGVKTRFTAVLSDENIEQIEELLQTSREMEIPLNAQPVVKGGARGTEKNWENLSRKKLERAIDKLMEFKEENPDLLSPSKSTLEDIRRVYLENGKIECGRGRITARIEGRKVTPCARAYDSEKEKLGDEFKDAWRELSRAPGCNYTCCTSALELANLWNLDLPTIKNQLINSSY